MSTPWEPVLRGYGKIDCIGIVHKYLMNPDPTNSQLDFVGLKAHLTPHLITKSYQCAQIAAPGSTGVPMLAGWDVCVTSTAAAKDYHASVVLWRIPARIRGAENAGWYWNWLHTFAKNARDRGSCQTSGGFWLQGSGTCSNDPPANQGDCEFNACTWNFTNSACGSTHAPECALAALIGRTTFQQAAIRHSGYSETRRADVAARRKQSSMDNGDYDSNYCVCIAAIGAWFAHILRRWQRVQND